MSDIKADGECKVGELDVAYNLDSKSEAKRNCQMDGDTRICSYESSSYVIIQKNGIQIAKIHVYPEERMFGPLKIAKIEVSDEKVDMCYSPKIDKVNCTSYTVEQLSAKPFISILEVFGVH